MTTPNVDDTQAATNIFLDVALLGTVVVIMLVVVANMMAWV